MLSLSSSSSSSLHELDKDNLSLPDDLSQDDLSGGLVLFLVRLTLIIIIVVVVLLKSVLFVALLALKNPVSLSLDFHLIRYADIDSLSLRMVFNYSEM